MDFLALVLEDLFDIVVKAFDFITNPIVKVFCQILAMVLCCVAFVVIFQGVSSLADCIIKHFGIINVIAKIIFQIISVIITFVLFIIFALIVKFFIEKIF